MATERTCWRCGVVHREPESPYAIPTEVACWITTGLLFVIASALVLALFQLRR